MRPYRILYLIIALALVPASARAIQIANLGNVARVTDCPPAENVLFRQKNDPVVTAALTVQTFLASPKLLVFSDAKPAAKTTRYVSCSSAVVSDEGHILTAGHCVQKCLARAGAFAPIAAGNQVSDVNGAALAAHPVECVIEVGGQRVSARVVTAGFCHNPRDFKKGLIQAQDVASCAGRFDYALLEPATPISGSPCFRMAPGPGKLGTRVGITGFPSKTDRLDDPNHNSDGKSQYASFGKLVNRTECDFTLLKSSKGVAAKGVIATKPLMQGYLQTTADIVPGNSGGPVFNQDAQIVGVVSSINVSLHNNSLECRGSGFATPADRMRQAIDATLGGAGSSARYFSCEKNAIRLKGELPPI